MCASRRARELSEIEAIRSPTASSALVLCPCAHRLPSHRRITREGGVVIVGATTVDISQKDRELLTDLLLDTLASPLDQTLPNDSSPTISTCSRGEKKVLTDRGEWLISKLEGFFPIRS